MAAGEAVVVAAAGVTFAMAAMLVAVAMARLVEDGGIEHRPGKVTGPVRCPECGHVEPGVHLGAVLCPYHDEPVVMDPIEEGDDER